MFHLKQTSSLNPTLSAIRFEIFDVKIVGDIFMSYALQMALLVLRNCSPMARPRYFPETTRPNELKYLSTP